MANQKQELPVNDQTQAVLSKYGITAPKKITNIQNIQNKTETDIKIVQPDIKISAPNIQINPVEIAIKRYKDWVEGAYGRQKILAQKQKQTLEENDYTLGKSLNRVFRKIEDIRGHIIDSSRNFKRKLDASMSSLVTLFIGSMIPIIWKPLMERIESIERGFKYLFFGDIPPGMSENPDSFTFARTIRQFLGMDDSEGKSLLQGIGDLISEGIDKIIKFLDIQKEDRYQAIQEVLKKPVPGFSWKNLLNAKEKLGENFEYIGDIMAALFGGSKAMTKRQSKKDAIKSIETDNNKKVGKWGSGKLINHALKEKTPAASYYLSDQAVKFINSKDTIDIEKLQLLLDEIRKLANSDNAYVSENFAKTFFGDKVKDLESSGKLKRTNIKINSSTDNKRIYDYFKESSQNGLWDKDEHRVQGFTPKAMKAYKMDKSAISDLFNNSMNHKSDLYAQENYDAVRESFKNLHKTIHGEDISSKATLLESTNRYQEINEQTKQNLEEWKNSDEFIHLNNFGNRLKRSVKGFNLGENIESLHTNEELTSKVINQAEEDLGKITYKFGGNSYNNTDCSGYISNVYNKFGINVPRGTLNVCKDANEGKKAKWVDVNSDPYSAIRQGTTEPNWDALKPGDIMVWSRYGSDFTNDREDYSYAGHVSLYTGKKDEQGKPIILGHSGPGPDSDKKPEVKGTKREGINDLRSYLGTVRYNLSNNYSKTTSEEKGDPGEGDEKKKTKPTSVESTTPLVLRDLPETEYHPTFTPTFKMETFIPEFSKKNPNEIEVPYLPESELEEEVVIDRNKYYKDILHNVNTTLGYVTAGVEFKKAHANEII